MHHRFDGVNSFWTSIQEFLDHDKHLLDLKDYPYIYDFSWSSQIDGPGIYLLFGSRQIGKTTSIKLYMARLLSKNRISPTQIFYLSCDSLIERDEIYRLLKSFLATVDHETASYVFVDEVTLIPKWELAIKALVDEGLFRNSVVIVTGSDSILLEDAASAFPGVNRRGKHGKNFYLHPLTFKQFVHLIDPSIQPIEQSIQRLDELFNKYLLCGGYLNAINDLMTQATISRTTYSTYEQWIVSDFIRKGKDKKKLIDLLRVLIERLNSQLSFNKIANESTLLTTDTVIDYINHLERLGILIVLHPFDQNSLGSFPKKDKKIHFTDPFLVRVLVGWLKSEGVIGSKFEPDVSHLVESVVVNAYATVGQRYYIKAEGKLDLVIVNDRHFYPIEVKWTEQIRAADLKQIRKYKNGLVLSKQLSDGKIEEVHIANLLKHLVGDLQLTPTR